MGCPTFEKQTERAIMASVDVLHTPEAHGIVGSVHPRCQIYVSSCDGLLLFDLFPSIVLIVHSVTTLTG